MLKDVKVLKLLASSYKNLCRASKGIAGTAGIARIAVIGRPDYVRLRRSRAITGVPRPRRCCAGWGGITAI